MKRGAAFGIAVLVALLFLSGAPAEESPAYYIDVGTDTLRLDYAPLISANGRNYLAYDLLQRLASFQELVVETKIRTGPQIEDSQEGEAISIQRSTLVGVEERAFLLNNKKYLLAKNEASLLSLLSSEATKVGSEALIRNGRAYLAQDTLFELGIALSFSPESGNMRLLGELVAAEVNNKEQQLEITTLLPSRASTSGMDAGFRVVMDAVFVKENYEIRTPAGLLRIRNLPYHRLEVVYEQESPTGYRIFADEKSQSRFTVHLANHFEVVSTEETSSGEIALTIGFTRPVEVKTQVLQSPPRLVLDFEGTIYRDATKYQDIKVGGVRQIRVGQFSESPPVVRVVVEMSRLLEYRILKQGSGEKYYVQMLSRRLGGAAIMLDAGHGGSDTGAIGVSGAYEKDIVLRTTLELGRRLKNMGYETVLTRSDDRFVSLGERADYANSALPIIFVSIHANAMEDPSFTGVMTFHFKGSREGLNLASAIQRALLSSTGAKDKLVRTANFFVLRETVVPSVLVEIGFLTNAIEEERLRDPHYQKRIVDGIANGIDEYMRTFGRM